MTRSRPASASRWASESVGTGRPGRSLTSTVASAAYTTSAAATTRYGRLSPCPAILGVKYPDSATPPMPMPKIPSARPRLAGGNHELTRGMPIANVVPPRPSRKPTASIAP